MITLTVTYSGPDRAAYAAARLRNGAEMHASMAGTTERFLKAFGRNTSTIKHATARRLGAQPTGHLADAYEAVESFSTADSASLWVPAASRLRAAFGEYTVRPTGGRRFLTIPVAREAYGRRAREFQGLFVMGGMDNGRRTRVLAMKGDGPMAQPRPYYLLVPEASIPEAPDLIPFADLATVAARAAEKYVTNQDGTP